MSVATLANKTYDISRATVTKDAGGGVTKAWAKVLRLRGRVQPLSAGESIRSSREEARVTHRGYFTGTPDIRPGDRISIARKLGTRYLHVHGVRNVDEADEYVAVEMEEREQ